VVLTVSEDSAVAEAALAAGALGYVTKAHAATDLVPAVDAAIGGHRFVSASMSRKVEGPRSTSSGSF
jgi:two-component system, NarL family, invasion response regulator UvrY